MDTLNQNELYEAAITGYTSEGLGVCRVKGAAVFVPGALEGETWRIRILRDLGTRAEARGEACLSPSPERRAPACPLFGQCGGCDTLHMSYAEELRFKLQKVNGALTRIGGLDLRAETILASDAELGYRNKAIYNAAPGPEGPQIGFYRPGTHQVVPLERCLLQPELSDRCARAVRDWMRLRGVPAWDGRQGAIRHVFVRVSRLGGAVCCLVTAAGLGKLTSSLVSALRSACPELTGIVLDLNKKAGNTVLAGDFYTLWGESELRDTLCGFEFSLSPQAFYQINPPQAEKLYALAAEMACPAGTGAVLDLYCGAGTISLCLARRCQRVYGAEIVPEAVENARQNAARNGVTNAEFLCADAGRAALELSRRGVRPDAVTVDPPRKGMAPEAVEAVASLSPARIAYVSCDPATLARDLKRFAELGYRPVRATAVDMFPRTCHVETVVLMSKVEK